MSSHLLLVACPDAPGLIHGITGIVYRHQGNIVSNSEFVDQETAQFFMRTEYKGPSDPVAVSREVKALLPKTAHVRCADMEPRRIVVLATKEHHCLGDLLLRHAHGEINANILAVISNHETLGDLVRQFGLPFHFVDHAHKNRPDHENAILGLLEPYRPEYLVLAKYMRILTPGFITRFPYRIINIHHSFLPAFIGASPYRQAFERGVKLVGATAHFVTDDLDTGPIIAQDVIPVRHTHGAKDMAQAGRDVEKVVLAKALGLVLEERVFLCGNRTIIFD
ncbi:MAG: formyltetrahydrofolate deformylase [Gammaproteobacteria bacterium]|nr:formyltetrahydrofolate deformylase [Gammaproteobacteria bacterium]